MGKVLSGNSKEILGTLKVLYFETLYFANQKQFLSWDISITAFHNKKLILGLYSDQTRGVYLLCLLLEAIQPLGWRLVSSADISSKNLDANERGYSLVST